MIRNPQFSTVRWIAHGTWLWLLLGLPWIFFQPVDIERPADSSYEQTTPDVRSAEKLETPAQQRRAHLTKLGIERWHRHSRRGQGVKIAILDSGFRDYRNFLGKGLPAKVTVRSFRKDQNLEARDSQHGILCGEILHALAPEAELLLANWETDDAQAFLDAVRWAKAEGAKIISCSLIMPGWSDGEGGGGVHRALQEVLGNGRSARDVMCFASAGNVAERHWFGDFAPNDSGWHQWKDDVTRNVLKPWGDDRVAVEFYGTVRSTYEIHVIHERTGKPVGTATLRMDAAQTWGRAQVRFEPEPDSAYYLRVRRLDDRAGSKREAFHVVVLGASLETMTSRGSIPFPGDGATVYAVGAVDAQKRRASYSSCGPNSILPKPDFVATVPFPSLCRQHPFSGTSAAAPQAAGLAALLWSHYPCWTPNQIHQKMRETALDLGPPGHDYDTGYGLIRLPPP
jgi:subtilisin family serine protease